jgi:outer membrane lipoprotein-sorting protein
LAESLCEPQQKCKHRSHVPQGAQRVNSILVFYLLLINNKLREKFLKRFIVPNRKMFMFLLLLFNFSLLFGQEIVTASRFLEMVSERYASIRDYEANIAIRSGNQEMAGTVSHLSPSFLRIDFTRPADQVIVFNGDLLTIYLPEFRAILNQNINQSRRSGATQAGMASAQGLTMLRRNYVPSFVTGPNPEPLDSSNSERVVKLRLTRSSIAEGFREIILSVNPDTLLIRRIEGRTLADGLVQFDFTNVITNVGIPAQRFVYEAPGSANIINNFLFRDTD